MNIVVVEDDRRVADFIERGLRAEGYAVTVARTGPEGLAQIDSKQPDLAVLDIMLPGASGLDVCQELRAAGNRVPILILTALDSVADRVTGLRMGADDYLTKPFAFDELLARIDALLRRSAVSATLQNAVRAGDIEFDRESVTVKVRGNPVDLTAKELALLDLLISKPGRVFSRARILSIVWGMSTDPLTNVVEVYIRKLRTKLDAPGDESLIQTVRGFGYKLRPDADNETTAAPDDGSVR